jgi:hypothetical protein
MTTLYQAYLAADRAWAVADSNYRECEDEDQIAPLHQKVNIARQATEAARKALRESDEVRPWELFDDEAELMTVEARPSEVLERLRAEVTKINAEAAGEGEPLTVHGLAYCEATDERVTIEVEINNVPSNRKETMSKLRPGTYRLSQTVENPACDRRKRRDWRSAERWEAGETFVIVEDELPMPDDLPSLFRPMITRPSSKLYQLRLDSDVGKALAAHLVALEEEPSDWLKRTASANLALAILDRLHAVGKISKADIEAAHEACLEDKKKEA